MRTNAAIGDTLKVGYMKLAPSGFGLKGAPEGESAKQKAANEEANRHAPRANPLFDPSALQQ